MNEPNSDTLLTEEEQTLALNLARLTVEQWVTQSQRLDWQTPTLTETLQALGGCFVTIHAAGNLRGCIGSIAFIHPLAKSVRDNAISAAHRDPRFDPIQTAELDTLSIEISALTPGDQPGSPFRRVTHIEEIQIGRDGLCIEQGKARGLLLPQVAAERNWTREQFLAATCMKAGLEQKSWRENGVVISRFTAEVFGDRNVAPD